jgi:acyl-CoA synthetase (AMP-forming)/AMP-acid ligase II
VPLTVPALLAQRAAGRSTHAFLIGDHDTLTYGEAERRSAAVAKGLIAAGVGKGSHVGVIYPNNAAFVVAWLAAARIGAVTLPLSTFSTAAELQTLVRNADVEVLLSTARYRSHDFVADLSSADIALTATNPPPLHALTLPSLRRIAFDGAASDVPRGWSLEELIASGEGISDELLHAMEERVSPADRMVIIHTSGSTNEPKGVIHRHGSLIRHMANINAVRRYEADEVYFSNSPFFWIGGFAYVLLATLVTGATLVCSTEADAADVLDLLERTRPTMVSGFAASVAHLAKHPSFPQRDLTSIRRGNLWPILPAAIKPSDPLLRHQMLGLTEAGSIALLSDDESDQPAHRRGSFGRPAPECEARIIAEDGSASGPGQVGELWIRGPFLMEGYYGRERGDTFTPDGWYRTGDLFHTDDDGFYYFDGRSGGLIKTAGANVSPREVESAFRAVAGLAAHVYGLADDERGEIVGAVVRVPAGREIDPDALRTELRSTLSAYKVPQRILLVPEAEVPIMANGKVDLRDLKRRLEAAE